MKNAKLIIVWMVLLCVLMIFGIGAYLWNGEYFLDKNVAIATTQSADVFLITKGIQTAITGQKVLSVGDSLQTTNGESLLTINENHFLWLKKNTKITLVTLDKQNVEIKLDDGDVWYMHVNSTDTQKFVLRNSLETIEPLGTKFFAHFNLTESSADVFVVEGIVKINDDFAHLTLVPFEKAHKTDTEGLSKVDLNLADKEIATQQLDRDYSILVSARNQEINKHDTILAVVKNKFNVTDEQIQETLTDLDTGKLSEQELIEQSPVPIIGVDRIRELNAAAKETLSINNQLQTQ